MRAGEKAADEAQAVSAHLIIATEPIAPGRYAVALEEIPGLSTAPLLRIFRSALHTYPYPFKDQKERVEDTYMTLKCEGKKSETLANALEKGTFREIKLVRPLTVDVPDAAGLFEAGTETATLKVKADLDSQDWMQKIKRLRYAFAEKGWTEFNIDIRLDDNRNRTVRLDQQVEAEEILFVRSEQLFFETSIPACSVAIVDEIVEKALDILEEN